jgi:hypothetical protein
MKHQLSRGRTGFYFLSQRLQLDTPGLKLVGQMNEISEASAESIKPPDNKSVTFPQRFQTGFELWAV